MTSATAAPEAHRLRTDVVLMSLSRGAILVLGLAQSIIVSRALGPSGRGSVAVAVSIITLLTQLGSMGLVTANAYFSARDRSTPGVVAINSLWFASVAGCGLAAAAFGMKIVVPTAVSALTWSELAVAAAAIPATLAGSMLQAILLGEARSLAYNGVSALLQAAIVVAVATSIRVFHAGVLGVLIAIAAGQATSAVCYFSLVRRPGVAWRPDFDLARRMLVYGIRVYVATVLAFVVIRIDVLLVNAYRGADDTGVYAVTVSAVDALYLIPAVVGLSLFAHVARGARRSLSAQVFRTLLPIWGAVVLLSVPAAAPAVHLLYGTRFADAADLYYWIAPGVFCLGMVTVLSNHFAGRGFPIVVMLMWLVGVVVNVAINLLFLPDGLFVAPLASSVAYAVLLVMHVVGFARDIGSYHELVPRFADVTAIVRRGDSPGLGNVPH